jgi:hypothetical protein
VVRPSPSVHKSTRVANTVARSYGLVFSLPEDLREVYNGFGLNLLADNGDSTFELPSRPPSSSTPTASSAGASSTPTTRSGPNPTTSSRRWPHSDVSGRPWSAPEGRPTEHAGWRPVAASSLTPRSGARKSSGRRTPSGEGDRAENRSDATGRRRSLRIRRAQYEPAEGSRGDTR